MNEQKLMDWISSLSQDIDFEYGGKLGSICPFSSTEIALYYNGKSVTVQSVEAAMKEPFIDNHSLAELCTELII